MLSILLSTGIERPRDWLANPPVIFGVVGAVVIGLWLAMLVARSAGAAEPWRPAR